MAKVLFINPSKWGRGIPIWIASHSSVLKSNNHNVELFDSTFLKIGVKTKLNIIPLITSINQVITINI